MPNTFGIAMKGTLEKTGRPIELGINKGTIRVITIKSSYSIFNSCGIEDEFIVGGIEFT